MIACTLPTCPSWSRTFMPCGWFGEFVSMSLTIPRVRLPVRWSCLSTISTSSPGWMSFLNWPFKLDHLFEP